MTLPASVLEWSAIGTTTAIGADEHFVVDLGPRDSPPIVMFHGFPGSSFDWRHVATALSDRWRVVLFDFLGFGLSAKPPDGDYSLFSQADRVEQLLADLGIDTAVFAAHDIGDTVLAELLQRANEDRLTVKVLGALITNGSIFIDLVQFSAGQLFLLGLPNEVLPESFGTEATATGLRASFPAGRPSPEELDSIVALVHHRDGDLLMPRLIRYIEERRKHQERWTAGLRDFAGPIAAYWGDRDPIAMAAMADRLAAIRTQAGHPVTVEHWDDAGHWPIVEVPDRVATALDAKAREWTRRTG